MSDEEAIKAEVKKLAEAVKDYWFQEHHSEEAVRRNVNASTFRNIQLLAKHFVDLRRETEDIAGGHEPDFLAIIQSNLTYEENLAEITKAFKGENYDPDNDLDNLVKSKNDVLEHVYNLEDAKNYFSLSDEEAIAWLEKRSRKLLETEEKLRSLRQDLKTYEQKHEMLTVEKEKLFSEKNVKDQELQQLRKDYLLLKEEFDSIRNFVTVEVVENAVRFTWGIMTYDLKGGEKVKLPREVAEALIKTGQVKVPEQKLVMLPKPNNPVEEARKLWIQYRSMITVNKRLEADGILRQLKQLRPKIFI